MISFKVGDEALTYYLYMQQRQELEKLRKQIQELDPEFKKQQAEIVRTSKEIEEKRRSSPQRTISMPDKKGIILVGSLCLIGFWAALFKKR